eukprot:1311808-Rhodomonas_salina.1
MCRRNTSSGSSTATPLTPLPTGTAISVLSGLVPPPKFSRAHLRHNAPDSEDWDSSCSAMLVQFDRTCYTELGAAAVQPSRWQAEKLAASEVLFLLPPPSSSSSSGFSAAPLRLRLRLLKKALCPL